LKGAALEITVWRIRFGRGCRAVIRQTAGWWFVWGESC